MSSAFSEAAACFLLSVEANFLDVLPNRGFQPAFDRHPPPNVLSDLGRRHGDRWHRHHVDTVSILTFEALDDAFRLSVLSRHHRQATKVQEPGGVFPLVEALEGI